MISVRKISQFRKTKDTSDVKLEVKKKPAINQFNSIYTSYLRYT